VATLRRQSRCHRLVKLVETAFAESAVPALVLASKSARLIPSSYQSPADVDVPNGIAAVPDHRTRGDVA
jgi:hypothetical protein